MNSVLQCLIHTPAVNRYLEQRQHSAKCRARATKPHAFCLGCSLEELMHRTFARGTQSAAYAPRDIATALPDIARGFRLGRQEDAHEFMRCSLDRLTKEFAPLTESSKPPGTHGRYTALQAWLSGSLQSQIRCLACLHESNTHDPFLDLSLELISHGGRPVSTLDAAMRLFCQEEFLDGDNRYMCAKCNGLQCARKQLTLFRPPKFLTVQLKRFSFGGAGTFGPSSSGKISSHVAFPAEWNLTAFSSAYSELGASAPQLRYRLYAVLVHEGGSTNSGHYYCYVRSLKPSDKASAWWCLNDSRVRPVNESTVFGACAYILFYALIANEDSAGGAQHRARGGAHRVSAAHDGTTEAMPPATLSHRTIGPQLPPAFVHAWTAGQSPPGAWSQSPLIGPQLPAMGASVVPIIGPQLPPAVHPDDAMIGPGSPLALLAPGGGGGAHADEIVPGVASDDENRRTASASAPPADRQQCDGCLCQAAPAQAQPERLATRGGQVGAVHVPQLPEELRPRRGAGDEATAVARTRGGESHAPSAGCVHATRASASMGGGEEDERTRRAVAEEDVLLGERVYGCEVIQRMGVMLELCQVAIATAQDSLHRFYSRHSMRDDDVRVSTNLLPCPRSVPRPRFRSLILAHVRAARRSASPLALAVPMAVSSMHAALSPTRTADGGRPLMLVPSRVTRLAVRIMRGAPARAELRRGAAANARGARRLLAPDGSPRRDGERTSRLAFGWLCATSGRGRAHDGRTIDDDQLRVVRAAQDGPECCLRSH